MSLEDLRAVSELSPAERSLADRSLDWCDQWWDDERGLVWGPPGHEGVDAPETLHLIPQSAWYAVGLFGRDRGDDRERAVRAIEALLDLQYDEEGTDWHGTFPLMAETPHPPERATMWDDYDPNWRQFLGLSWLLLLGGHGADLPSSTRSRLEASLRLAVDGEPEHRCPPTYTNIALKRSAFETLVGEYLDEPTYVARGERIATAVAELHDVHGAFEEFNSPTYAGVDLYALAMGRSLASSSVVVDICTRLEQGLWHELAAFWNPALGNLCAPWTRTYGMDMGRYLAKLSLQLWAAGGERAAAHPGFAPDVAHGHDWFAGAATARVGTAVPAAVRLGSGSGPERTVEQTIATGRTATAWITDEAMIGAEACTADLAWWDQYVAAALHWRRPDGGVGWLSVRRPGRSGARAEAGRLQVPRADGADIGDPNDVVIMLDATGVDPGRLDRTRWELPGVTLEVAGADEDWSVRAGRQAIRLTARCADVTIAID